MELKDNLASVERAFSKLGTSPETEEEKLSILTNIILDFAQKYTAQADGQRKQEINTKIPTKGAKLTLILEQNFRQSLDKLDALTSITDDDILIGTSNVGRQCRHLFVPQVN